MMRSAMDMDMYVYSKTQPVDESSGPFKSKVVPDKISDFSDFLTQTIFNVTSRDRRDVYGWVKQLENAPHIPPSAPSDSSLTTQNSETDDRVHECFYKNLGPGLKFTVRNTEHRVVLGWEHSKSRRVFTGTRVLVGQEDSKYSADSRKCRFAHGWFADHKDIIHSSLNYMVLDTAAINGEEVVLQQYNPNNQRHQWMLKGDQLINHHFPGRCIALIEDERGNLEISFLDRSDKEANCWTVEYV